MKRSVSVCVCLCSLCVCVSISMSFVCFSKAGLHWSRACGCPPSRSPIEELQRARLLAPGLEAVAGFLDACHGILDPRVIGAIISPVRPTPTLTSNAAWDAAKPLGLAYMRRRDMAGLHVVDALVALLTRVSMPNHSRAVSFVLKMFSRRFLETAAAVPGSEAARNFTDLDSVYLLVYSVFVLNGDLYNRTLKSHQRMTRDAFITMSTHVPAITATPEYLGSVYDRVAALELPLRGWKTELAPRPTSPGATIRKALTSTVSRLRSMLPSWTRR